jgi:hypothetical protein
LSTQDPGAPPGVGVGPENRDQEMLDLLQRETFSYFPTEANPANGLVRDKTAPEWPSNIAVQGLAFASYVIGVERGFWSRDEAVKRTLAALRFLRDSPQGREPDATGYRGFYYHFLDMDTGRRAWDCELSTVDTAFLIAGALAAAEYFQNDDEEESEIRKTVDALYRRIDWAWALDGGSTLTHGWKPESGFLPFRWEGFDEALILYVLALGSPTHAIAPECYRAWGSTYEWRKLYDLEFFYAGPLFIHQLSHAWIDFRGIQDEFVRQYGIDYFENSRRATLVQQRYAIHNPSGFNHYGRDCWGITASDGPGPATLTVDGIERQFYGYLARGAPLGPDDGTISPWAVVASLPFTPEIVLSTTRHFIEEIQLKSRHIYGFEASFNGTYPEKTNSEFGWVSPWIFGLNQGPIVMMIENVRNELMWRLMRKCRYVGGGLRLAGFRGGWL